LDSKISPRRATLLDFAQWGADGWPKMAPTPPMPPVIAAPVR
jgi:hypothetical protein